MSAAIYKLARESHELPDFWRSLGFPLKKSGGKKDRYESSYTPCCGQHHREDAGSIFRHRDTLEWRWMCFPCGTGGTIIDLVAAVEGINHHAAARKIVQDAGGYQVVKKKLTERHTPAEKPVGDVERQLAITTVQQILLEQCRPDEGSIRYLTETRMISRTTVDDAWERGMLRTLPFDPDQCNTWLRLNIGNELLEKTGLLAPKRRWPAIAYRPIVLFPPGGKCMEFRVATEKYVSPKALQYGEKAMPLVWRPKSGNVRRVLVVEGGIDLLSTVDLGMSQDTLILGPLGTSAWNDKWIGSIRNRYPNAEWLVGFDPDKAGDTIAPRLLETLISAGMPARRVLPCGVAPDQDWNDSLKASRAF
ncbi:TPA: toprim domain-containing protein [Stenotrophomonas maltophilia]